MSRCFPFPPPGYEPKACTGIFDLSAKEKQQQEKKHKKEKGDKEKRKHREKRDEDRSKDKRKGNKDLSHRDRKKENDRVKGWTTEDIKVDGRTQGHKESWQKTDEIKDSKFEEELGKRTRDDGAENPMVANFTNSVQRKVEEVGATIFSLEKERVADSRVFSVQVVSVRSRNDRSDLPIENVSISLERRVECISNATAMEKERSKMHEKVFVGRGSEQSRNHGISWSTQSISGLVNRKSDGFTAGMDKDKYGERNSVSNFVVPGLERGKLAAKTLASSSLAAAQRRKDVLGLSVENLSIVGKTEVVGTPSLYSRIEGMDTVPPIKKEKSSGGEMFQRHIGQAVEKDIHQKVERKNKTQGNKADDRKRQNDSAHIVKKKASDKDRLTKEKKKEENTVENAEDIEQTRFRNFGKKDQVNTIYCKPLTPHTDNSIGITPHTDNAIGIECFDRSMRKRKVLDTNGYLQENNERPVKIPRMISSSVNGRSSDSHTAPSNVFLKSGAINNLRQDRLIENKERMINGNAISQQSPIELRPPASGDFNKNPDVSFVLLPHPDSKYLSQIYTVPKMVELPDIDDQNWLFDSNDSLQESKIESKIEPKVEKIPQVFSEAMRIDLADILALPYVVPF